LVLIGLVGGGIPFALFFNGLSLIGSTTANIINKSLFLWVAVLAVTLLKEKLHWVSVIGYGILFFALFWGSKITISGGLLLVLAATLFWAVEHVIAKITLKNVSPLVVSWSRMIFGLPVLAIISLFTGKTQIGLTQPVFLSLLVSAGFLIIYMLSWYSSIKAASVSLVASVLVLAPVITLILNTLVNHKPLQIPNLITSGLTILGIFLIVIPGIRKSASRKLPYGV
jgi:drug/metabolite transporter (DMT)-like permease